MYICDHVDVWHPPSSYDVDPFLLLGLHPCQQQSYQSDNLITI